MDTDGMWLCLFVIGLCAAVVWWREAGTPQQTTQRTSNKHTWHKHYNRPVRS